MAGDWIPVSVDLIAKPEVLRLERNTSKTRHEVVGLLVHFWCWASNHSPDGILPVDISDLSRLIGADIAFWEEVVKVGWLQAKENKVVVPNCERWISRGAKARLKSRDRMKVLRSQRNGSVTTEQKRREHKKRNTKKSEAAFTSEFLEFWEACPRKASKQAAWNKWPVAKRRAEQSELRSQDEPVVQFLIRRMQDYAAAVSTAELRFVKHPSTWLNGGCWDDETPSRLPTDDDLKSWNP